MQPILRRLSCLPALFLLFLAPSLRAQVIPYYSFSQLNGSYTTVTGGTLLDTGGAIGDQRYAVALPFPFVLENISYTQGFVSANGFLSLGTVDPGGTNYAPIASTSSGFAVISAFGRDLNSLNSVSSIRTETTGSISNRVFTVQWRNLSYQISTGITMNFQVKLYENGNKIDIVYGGNSTSINTITGQVGLRGTSNSTFHARSPIAGWTVTSQSPANSAIL